MRPGLRTGAFCKALDYVGAGVRIETADTGEGKGEAGHKERWKIEEVGGAGGIKSGTS